MAATIITVVFVQYIAAFIGTSNFGADLLFCCRLAQLPLIRIGPLQVLMTQEKMPCIALVLLARYQ